ncbi:hypothetical protein WR164_03400 [Philodulcilactobacillus myokoensis]|uniref:Uncharacterized protein n=1 Tax=Philodulcilactobacillus myokoensis TaxID=2929573 RepID=A0A9W6B065_9LACO|nr:hypothetical protein WR164_03400 [Philodulcilactobacillus myokoensis]
MVNTLIKFITTLIDSFLFFILYSAIFVLIYAFIAVFNRNQLFVNILSLNNIMINYGATMVVIYIILIIFMYCWIRYEIDDYSDDYIIKYKILLNSSKKFNLKRIIESVFLFIFLILFYCFINSALNVKNIKKVDPYLPLYVIYISFYLSYHYKVLIYKINNMQDKTFIAFITTLITATATIIGAIIAAIFEN